METLKYVRLHVGDEVPDLSEFRAFRAVVIVEEDVSADWRAKLSEWLVESGCLYMLAWGDGCSDWDDSVDWVNLDKFDFAEIPDEKFVMTTWHENESLEEIFWFAKHSATHPTENLDSTLLLHISNANRESQLIEQYRGA